MYYFRTTCDRGVTGLSPSTPNDGIRAQPFIILKLIPFNVGSFFLFWKKRFSGDVESGRKFPVDSSRQNPRNVTLFPVELSFRAGMHRENSTLLSICFVKRNYFFFFQGKPIIRNAVVTRMLYQSSATQRKAYSGGHRQPLVVFLLVCRVLFPRGLSCRVFVCV